MLRMTACSIIILMSDNVQQIKDNLDLLEYLKPIISLKPSGKNWKGLCPFHKEKTPSFMVSPDRGIWHCFGGCNAGGDIFSFVMKYENVEFYEALKILAEKAGIDLKRIGSSDWQKYDRLYEINEAAKSFFKQSLTQPSAAYNYLRERGLKDETIEEFEIGLAAGASDGLLRHLMKLGFSLEDVERAGVVFRTERGTYWDRFRNRIMFPLYNSSGKVVGFTGRVLELENASSPQDPRVLRRPAFDIQKSAKYVNSPETPIFQKSKFLYGFHKTKQAIREAQLAVLVEGQMDFLMSWQDGLKNVVATSGTALTHDHLTLLKRYCDQLVLSFDSDSAGQNAAERSIDLAMEEDFSVKILTIPEGKDPADVVRSQTGLMAQLADQAQPIMDFYFRRYLGAELVGGRSLYTHKKNLRAILIKTQNIASPIEKSIWLKELAKKTGLEESVLMEEMGALAVSKSVDKRPTHPSSLGTTEGAVSPIGRKDIIVKRIFGLVYHNPEFFKVIQPDQEFFPQIYQPVFAYFAGLPVDEQTKKIIDAISLQPDGAQEELWELLKQIKLEFYRHRQKMIRSIIHKTEITKDELALAEAMKEFDIVSRELHTLIHEENFKKAEEAKEAVDQSQAEENFF